MHQHVVVLAYEIFFVANVLFGQETECCEDEDQGPDHVERSYSTVPSWSFQLPFVQAFVYKEWESPSKSCGKPITRSNGVDDYGRPGYEQREAPRIPPTNHVVAKQTFTARGSYDLLRESASHARSHLTATTPQIPQ